jgi:hypothetical protein
MQDFLLILCGIKCTSCPTCNQTCKDFEKEHCKRLDKAPYVCNSCTKKINHCIIAHKYNYNARFSNRKYREKLHDSRSGINITRQQLRQKDEIRCTEGAVRLVFDNLEKRMGTYEFASAFEYILTDRGSEFGDPVALETLGEETLKAFQLRPIEPDLVNLMPKPIRFNH